MNSIPGDTQGQFHDFSDKQFGYELVRNVAFTVVHNARLTTLKNYKMHFLASLDYLIIFYFGPLGSCFVFVCLCFELQLYTYIPYFLE